MAAVVSSRSRKGALHLSTALLACIAALLLLAGCGNRTPAEGVAAVKLFVDEDGLYEVSGRALSEVGFDVGAAVDTLSLSAGGSPVPFEVVGQGRDAAIRFRGLRLSPDSYAPVNVYWLDRGAKAEDTGARPQPTATPQAGTAVTATVRLEEDLQYDPLAVQAVDRWYWQTFFAPAQVEIPFEAPGADSAAGELRAYVIAKSSADANPDHRLLLSLNGTLVSDAPWDGATPHLISAAIPAGLLREKDNRLLIQAPGDTGAPVDSVQLQWVEVSYARSDGAGTEAAREVRTIRAVTGSPLPNWPGGADLVIVTVPQFRDALKPLVEEREKQGLRVAVLDVEQVYDAFSFGRTDPSAIRALMQHARQNWEGAAPRYLLLAGDASYDTLGRTEGGEADLIPTRPVYTTFSGWTGSDVWYALPDEGEHTQPAFAVGRFPAQTPEQISAMIAKTLAYEREGDDLSWRSTALLVADNDEAAFAEETSAFAGGLASFNTELLTIEGDGAGAREALNGAFREGTGLIGYFGHGSVTLWGKEKVFDVGEAAKLQNRDRLPVVFTVTCLSGYFEHPTTVSLGETLVRNPNGGAVAALVPSSAALLEDQRLLAGGLAAALSNRTARTLGDIIHEAQLTLPPANGGVREILLTFNLLGDPSLTIKR